MKKLLITTAALMLGLSAVTNLVSELSGANRQAGDQKCVLRHGKVAEKSCVLERPIRVSVPPLIEKACDE